MAWKVRRRGFRVVVQTSLAVELGCDSKLVAEEGIGQACRVIRDDRPSRPLGPWKRDLYATIQREMKLRGPPVRGDQGHLHRRRSRCRPDGLLDRRAQKRLDAAVLFP